jgi:predicted chitinase
MKFDNRNKIIHMKPLALLLIIILSLIAFCAHCCGRRYTVACGDYCWKIATENGMSVDQLRGINPGLNCDNLQTDVDVCIASVPGPAPGRGPGFAPGPDPFGVNFDKFAYAVTSCGYLKPEEVKYNAFKNNYASAGGITSKRELAMFLAQILHESGGLTKISEIRCQGNNCVDDYRSPGDHSNKFYFGRGYIQLTWSENYRAASQALYGDDRLYSNPDLVARDENVAWQTAFWYWKHKVRSDPGVLAGKLGSATNRINGRLECNPCRAACHTRFELYKKVLFAFGDSSYASNDGC